MFLVFPICFAYTNAKEKYVNDGKRREKPPDSRRAGAAVSRRETRAALCQSVSAARRRGSLRSVYGCESQHGYARALRGLSDAAALAKAEPEEIEPYIKTCGLFHNKAKNLVLMARELVARFGGEVPADHDALESLPGVGRKTANVVMSCAFGEDAIAVDTHVFRVTNRLGLGGRAGCAQDRASAHAGRSQRSVEPRAPLADLPRPPRLRRAQTRVRNLHAARMVRLRERESQKQEIMAKARTSRLFSIREVRAFLIHEKLLKNHPRAQNFGVLQIAAEVQAVSAAYFFFRFIAASTAAQRPSVAPQRSTGWRRPSAGGWTYPARAQPRSFRKPSVPRIPAL